MCAILLVERVLVHIFVDSPAKRTVSSGEQGDVTCGFLPILCRSKGEDMKIITRTALSLALLAAGFAVGFPVGKDAGFTAGSEWALMQAKLLAREAGVFMPVSLEQGQFRVVIKQPRNLYKRAWQLADKEEERVPWLISGEQTLTRTVQLAGRVTMKP
jgi:hypothetical protein